MATKRDLTSSAASKLPHITAAFWVMKIAATTLGETAGDLLSMTLKVGYAASSVILMSAFVLSLGAQLVVTTYRPPLYWFVILTTSTAGTTMSDYMNRTLGLGYATGSSILVGILVGIFASWRYATGSLAVDDVRSRKAELFYWIAILFSNTLGTSLGDYLADSSGLGFGGGAMLIGGLLCLVLVLTFATRISRVLLFWIAFVLTRPFGATLGDVLTKPTDKGGLDLGTIGSSAVLGSVLVVLVVWSSVRQARRARLASLLAFGISLGLVTSCGAPSPQTPEERLRASLGVPGDAPRVIVFAQTAHLDIDWQRTFDDYYTMFVDDILTQARGVLEAQPRAFYSVAEMAFLEHHVEVHPEELPRLRDAALRGALRIVGGGMTSPDTLLPETELLLHDYLYGARFAEDVLGAHLQAAWLPDSFGHAATVPDVLAAVGLTSVAFARVDGAPTLYEQLVHPGAMLRPGSTAAMLKELGSADFLWRGPGGGSVLAHYMTHNFYCGGDDIDYEEMLQIPGGHLGVYDGDQPASTDAKIDSYIAALSPYAKTPYLFIPVGCDFQYPKEKLLEYLDGYNQRRYPATGVYAVAAPFDDYATLVLAHKDALPSMAADLTPYYEGFYGTRAGVKAAVRSATRPFLEAELFATALGADGAAALGSAQHDLELLTRADHHDFVTGTANDAVVATEQLPLLATAQAAGDAALASVVAAIGSRIPSASGSRARVLVLNPSGATRSAELTAHIAFVPPLADAAVHAMSGAGEVAVAVVASQGAAGAITSADVRLAVDELAPFSWTAFDFIPGPVTPPISRLAVQLLDSNGQPATGAAVVRVVLSNDHVTAEWRRESGFALTSLVLDSVELLSGPSFVVHDAADQGGLWRIGSEMSGCAYTPLPASSTEADAETVEVIAQTSASVTVAFKTSSATREARLGAADRGLELAVTTSATRAQTRTASFAFAVGGMPVFRTSLAGGFADRQPQKSYDPTFWPAVEWAQAGEAAVLLRQSTGVRFSTSGDVELMVVRDAEQEACDSEGGVGTDLGLHRIEWRIEHAASAAAATLAAQAFNRPIVAMSIGAPNSADLPTQRSLFQLNGDGILSTAKLADRGDGVIVRVLLVPGPVTVTLPTSLVGRTLTRVDAAERDLEALGVTTSQVTLDRDHFGTIASVRIH